MVRKSQFCMGETEVCMLLGKLMATSWSCVSFVLMREGTKNAILLPTSGTLLFLSTLDAFDGSREVWPVKASSTVPPFFKEIEW